MNVPHGLSALVTDTLETLGALEQKLADVHNRLAAAGHPRTAKALEALQQTRKARELLEEAARPRSPLQVTTDRMAFARELLAGVRRGTGRDS